MKNFDNSDYYMPSMTIICQNSVNNKCDALKKLLEVYETIINDFIKTVMKLNTKQIQAYNGPS